MLANASNWMLHEKFVKLYNASVYEKLDAVKNASKPFYDADKLEAIHLEKKNTSMAEVCIFLFKKRGFHVISFGH